MSNNKTKIGGQAVLEGVMMRGRTSTALAVRDSEGDILLETQRLREPGVLRRIPFIRGVVNMYLNFKDGMGYTTRSAELWGEEELTEDGKKSARQAAVATGIGIVLGIVLALVLFVFLPEYLTRIIFNLCAGRVTTGGFGEFFTSLVAEYTDKPIFLWNLTAGLIKIGVFVLYLVLITLMDGIRRLFMYHGAEHRTINCFEKGLPLTVKNVQGCSTYHDRCGTAFVFFVIIIAILTVSVVETWLINVTNDLQKAILRIILIVPVASLSYELLMFNARHDWFFLKPLKWLGRAMQTLSTKKPDDSMAEVAIRAFTAVLEMEANPDIKPFAYPKTVTIGEYKERAMVKLIENDIDDSAAIDWILTHVLKKQRSELKDTMSIGCGVQLKCDRLVARLAEGEPLQYILNSQQFFEYEFEVNKNVLIPRPESEYLTAKILKVLKGGERVLDLCCGSGAIGITLSLKAGVKAVCSDISSDALSVTRRNAQKLGSSVQIVESNMFGSIEGSFDVIVSNPPYVKSGDIESLNKNVRDYEPRAALDGGEDGLDFYRVIGQEAAKFLNDGGILILETGEGQAQTIIGFLCGFTDVEILKDQYGIDRYIFARK